jgi:hypothetical protein
MRAVHLVGIAGERLGECLQIGDGRAHVLLVVGQQLLDMLERLARGLAERLPRHVLGHKHWRAVPRIEGRRVPFRAIEGDGGRTGDALEIDAGPRVATNRRCGIDGDLRNDQLGLVGIKGQPGHLAHAHAVEQHG